MTIYNHSTRKIAKWRTRAYALLFVTAASTNALQHSLPTSRNNRHGSSQRKPAFALGLAPEATAGIAAAMCGGAALLWFSGAEERSRRAEYTEWEAEERERREEMARRAYIEPRDDMNPWTVEELKQYDGTERDDGPILFAADGVVLNVAAGRHFYGPGCEYHIFAGRDCSRLLAKSKLEEETEEETSKPLTVAERAALAGWMWTFKSKYTTVGKLDGFDASTTAL
uniref:Cytochrome b5 heme-binding domain-containing protein n=1 Tax=Odontella aurita TaxID=265563 RepID=A0A7S4NAG0_9STRA|mmetsp:Transcript_55758/g.167093  ORF Transcript_55758/g.167093 Transcript_55758/m.167093 type:complete len:226 (+) Transcript_55758:203-880(+)|eukprot:CAMPEP_0113576978 /NCGR_PEP_ID=MMETSP0015_2-20120614/28614_1 /TAXON_ID=2838 /ORGANISM="Odontella" /LENGTH=225 /DNA_ID=CAMNT_0000480509 /DNA_START=189 /DNA_END=863 /DNA_ORIENTATION=- /assembly_acc=CAM_ASM_000160